MIRKFGDKNMTEMTIGKKRVLFSYTTPVVVFDGVDYFVTTKKFSRTTSRHINFYLNEEAATGPYKAFNTKKVDQATIEQMVKG